MAWIELPQTRARHPKTLRLAALIKKDRRYACGLLDDLWSWGLDAARDDGALIGLLPADIATALDFPAGRAKWLMGALVESGYVDLVDGTYYLHDWADYAGRLNRKRAANTERMRSARARNVQRTCANSADDVQGLPYPTVPNRTVPNPTVPRDITDLSIMPPCSSSTDAPARGDAFAEYFSSNLQHMSPGNYDQLREFLADGISEDVARFAVDTATAAGKPTWAFTRYLLNQWLTSEVKTVGDAKAYEQRRAESIKTASKPNPALNYEQRPIAGNGDELFIDLSTYGKGGST